MGRHESQAITPSALRWRGVGFIVVAFFAALWATWAITTLMTPPSVATWLGYIVTAIPTVALVAMGIHTMLRTRHLPPPGITTSRPARKTRRNYILVVVAEVIALNVAVNLLLTHHMAQFLPAAVAIIVGLHFFLLARVFRALALHVVGAVMTLAGTLAIFAIALGSSTAMANGCTELACAAALWASSFASWQHMRKSAAACSSVLETTEGQVEPGARHLQPCWYSPNPGASSSHPAGFAARYTRRSPPMHGQR